MKTIITTPLFYINSEPHIGHFYSMCIADFINIILKLQGDTNSYILTGTDEHGNKVSRAIENNEIENADKASNKFRSMAFDTFKSSTPYFLRTSFQSHNNLVLKMLKLIENQGMLYEGDYNGFYLEREERFVTDDEAKDISEEELEKKSEKGIYMYLSKDISIIENLYNNLSKQFINYSLNSQKEKSIFITRPAGQRGIQTNLLGNNYTLYVWLDALLGYLSGLSNIVDANEHVKFVHIIGKDIIRFHTSIWPTVLFYLGFSLPNSYIVHNHITFEKGVKISKSIKRSKNISENIINSTEMDFLRCFLLSNSITNDIEISSEKITSFTKNISNKIGNLINRTFYMVPEEYYSLDYELDDNSTLYISKIYSSIYNTFLNKTLHQVNPSEVFKSIITECMFLNQFISSKELWNKESKDIEICMILKSIKIILVVLSSFLYTRSVRILENNFFIKNPFSTEQLRYVTKKGLVTLI